MNLLTQFSCSLLLLISSLSARAQCPLTCMNNSFAGIDMVSEVLAQSGSPCVIQIRIINNSGLASVTAALIDFTEAVCTNCPTVSAGSTAVWTITANFACNIPGATAAITQEFASVCGNTSVCPLTGVVLLPVELSRFNAEILQEQVRLEWEVAAEVDNAGFKVQRSVDGIRWQEIGFVAGRGTSPLVYEYEFFDTAPMAGLSYYRLRQEDYDGRYEYSEVISVNLNTGSPALRLFPNPTGGVLSLQLEGVEPGFCRLRLFDLSGRTLKTEEFYVQENRFQTRLDLRGLSGGVYLAEITSRDQQWKKKLIIH